MNRDASNAGLGTADANRYLPTLERARAEGVTVRGTLWFLPIATNLLGRSPAEQHALAAVVLRARVERRHVEERATQLSRAVVAALPSAPDPPPQPFATRRHRYLLEREPVWSDCKTCEVQPGQMACAVCGGTGVVHSPDGQDNLVTRACRACSRGFVQCTTCAGEGFAVKCRVADVDDHEASLDYTYVPAMTLELETAVGELLDAYPPPGCLRVGLEEQHAGSAYRGATRSERTTFMGHDYSAALESARVAVRSLGLPGEVIGQDVQVYAWPILWLRYRGVGGQHEVALVVDGEGRLRALRG